MFKIQLDSDASSSGAFAACHRPGLSASVGSLVQGHPSAEWDVVSGAHSGYGPSHPNSNPRTPSEEEALGSRVSSLGEETGTPAFWLELLLLLL